MSNDTTPYFFPDPYATGEAVSVEAASLDDALKQLEQRRPKDQPKNTVQDTVQDTPQPKTEDSAPAPEADESIVERTHR